MEYQRLEIERIDFGDSDFMVFSGASGSHTGSGEIIYKGETYIALQINCDSVSSLGHFTYYCDAFGFICADGTTGRGPAEFTCASF